MISFQRLAIFDIEDGEALSPAIHWTLDGHPVATPGPVLFLPNPGAGTHTLTAQVTDSGLLSEADTVAVTVVDHPPRLTILTPARPTSGQAVVWVRGTALQLLRQSHDPDEPGGILGDQQVRKEALMIKGQAADESAPR